MPERIKHDLEVAFVILLMAVNAGLGFLGVLVVAAQHETCSGGVALCALFAIHFLLGCWLFSRFIDLTGSSELGDPYYDRG